MKFKILVVILFALGFAGLSRAQTSIFTYQGFFSDHNQAASGSYDFQFRLADAATNGNYLGDAMVKTNVAVNNGVFSVALETDNSVFNGAQRWLEIGVRPNGATGPFTVLQPLQPITSVPYATFSASSAAAGVASNLVAGISLTNVTVPGSSIQPGTITATQIDPATDAAYRINTNVLKAIAVAAATSSGQIRRIDVKQAFGAIGDGVTDDTAAIQASLDYLVSQSATNATLYFPPGTYKILGTLSMPPTRFPQDPVLGNNAGYRLTGAGMSVTKLVWPVVGSGIGLALTNISGYEGVTIEDLTLIGPLAGGGEHGNNSIGLAIGKYGPDTAWSGFNNTVRNCGIIGWGYGAAVTNQWQIVFDNCIVRSNTIEGLRFAGSHNVSVQNCQVGGGWDTACGIGVGFHIPLNGGFGDNAQVINCLFGPCTNGIFNGELNLTSLNNHLEGCGSYYTLLLPAATTIIGGYTLDYSVPWTNGFAAQIQMDSGAAPATILQNTWLTSSASAGRPLFNVLDTGWGFNLPIYVGAPSTSVWGRWNNTSNVFVYAFGRVPKPIWTYQLPLKNGPDFISGVTNDNSPAPWSVKGAMQVPRGSVGTIEFPIPHGLGFSNVVSEITVQGVVGENDLGFLLTPRHFSLGPTGALHYGTNGIGFSGITEGRTSIFYQTNSFGEDTFPRRCSYTISSLESPSTPVTNDLWIISWRLFSVETSIN